MKIGIDIRAACGKKTGKGWYTFNLIKELLGLPAQNEYILYTNKISGDVAQMLAKLGPTSKSPHIKVIHKNPFLWHFAVIKDFLKTGGDIFFAPTSFIIPAFLPRLKNLGFSQHELGSRGSRARAAKGRGASAPLSGAELVGVKREAFLVSPREKEIPCLAQPDL